MMAENHSEDLVKIDHPQIMKAIWNKTYITYILYTTDKSEVSILN